jgi:hypothetical protein
LLGYSVQRYQPEAVGYLLERGADPTLTDDTGLTPQQQAKLMKMTPVCEQFSLFAARREREAQEALQQAIQQYHSGLDAPMTLSRRRLQLQFR